MSDPQKDIEEMQKSMDEKDNSSLIKIIANRTNDQRQNLVKIYKEKYNKDLIEELKDKTGGDFEDAVVALFLPPLDLDCKELNKAMKGMGTNEDTLIEILVSRPSEILKAIIKRYKEMYNEDLIQMVKDETSGLFQKILISLLECKRSKNKKQKEADMNAKAQQLVDLGEDNWGNEDSAFFTIMTTASPIELIMISRNYHKITGKNILEIIDNKFSEDEQKVIKAIIYAKTNPSEYFTNRLHDSMKGAGTNEKLLTRIIVERDEIDMPIIKKIYKRIYQKELIDDIKDDTSGDYQSLLLELVSH